MKRLLTLISLGVALHLQINAQVLETGNGSMELLGLKDWTVEMIKDTLERIAPNQPLHACAAVLKQRLGFPETSVTYLTGDDGKTHLFSVLVEPGFKHLVKKHTPQFKTKNENHSGYDKLLKYYNTDFRTHQMALHVYPAWKSGDMEKVKKMLAQRKISLEAAKEIWDELARFDKPKDLSQALDFLKNDSNPLNRMNALTVLLNFPDASEAWHALLRAQLDRDPQNHVGSMAMVTVGLFTHFYSEKYGNEVNWSPMVEELRNLINGSHAFAFWPTVQLLNRTKIDPEIGKYILQDGGHLVTSLLKSTNQELKGEGLKLLKSATGQQFSGDAETWSKWLSEN